MDELDELIDKARQGDKEAFGKIYKLFQKRIYRYLNINLQNPDLSEDLCQETFLKMWNSLPTFKKTPTGSLQAYLFMIARNLMIDLSRKKKEVNIDEIEEPQTSENLEENLYKEEEKNKLTQAMSKLDELERQILVLRFFEELSFTEVSRVLKMREGALRVRTHRVLKKLKGILEEDG